MLSLVKSWLKGIDKIAGLEIKISNDLTKEYRLVVIKNKNGKISVEQSQTCIDSGDLKKYIQADTPIVLCITGKGVINRFTSNDQQENNPLSGINVNEIISQKYETPTGHFSSLIRQETVKAILSEISSEGFFVISITLGAYGTHHFLKITNSIKQNKIEFDGNVLVVDEKEELVEYFSDKISSSSDQYYKIAEEDIKGEHLNAYSIANSYLFFEEAQLEYCKIAGFTVLEEQKDLFQSKILWKRKGLVVLAITLVVLVVNFMVFSNLNKHNNVNRTKLSAYQSKLKKLDSLEKYVAEKKILLNDGGLSDNFSVSQFCDALAASVPGDVQLKELSINPVNVSASRKEKDVVYEQKKVSIKGITKNMSSLNQWLKILETKTGIENLKMEEYHYDQSLSAGYFVLEGNI